MRRFPIPHQKIAAGLHAARASLARARGPDWEDPETAARLRRYVQENHDVLAAAARHEVDLAQDARSPAVILSARAGLAAERAWVRGLRGAEAEPEHFRVVSTLALASGVLHGREPRDAEEDARWVERVAANAFDPRLLQRGAEWAGALAVPVLRGPWAVAAAAGLLAVVVAAPALTGASVLYEARRTVLLERTAALLPEPAPAPSLEADGSDGGFGTAEA